ncbi:MAG: CsbD family protein [Chloroflexi bacterium]|nr:MAG: CsbD family protein [Chloroflexota bacterium]
MADLETEGRFDRIKGRARAMWGDLTDDDFDKAQGNTENLIGRIKEKTGAASEDIRRKLNELFAEEEGRGKQPQETRESGETGSEYH